MIVSRDSHRCRACGYKVNIAYLPDGSRVCGMCSEPIPTTDRKKAA